MAFELEALPYANDALEPHIDKETMEIHHDRHHQAYVDNLNKAIAGTDAESASLEDILKNVSKYSPAVRNNGGGHYNHRLFWSVLGANAGGEPTGELATAINEAFGSFEELKKKLQEAGATRFGSGWSWLIVGADGKLAVTSTPNQDNPLMDVAEVKGTPIFGIDVWEHAYYLKYQNKRPAYLEAVFNVVNWDAVAKNYAAAK
ncbi:superoxide dismutase, Fe-Mn family [Sphingobacterium nematocida]|uniref:Superoxide dismutase n=1 Tax=Sphingobacterium nematocida TaxID=1513896 RepID=A0A1T5FRJ2_9SPHI|nr:superoxide dismutase [Sphingobacterium nematocida]SKB98793.1 superoxide dismutase, Fe-Mn family [Sphingobacterium nematocida]